MKINFNVTGERRKALVQAISDITGNQAVYVAGNIRSYAIGDYFVNKDGVLDYGKHTGFIEPLLTSLAERGFAHKPQGGDISPDESHYILSVEMPLYGFTDAALANLERLVASKAALIKKALGAEALPIERTEATLRFPWFSTDNSPEQIQAYALFVERLCTVAKVQKRITAVERTVENEKYAFRCFLLKLGFIGDEYKAARKILLLRLEGDSAFRTAKSVL